MRTVGAILKEERLNKGFTLTQVEKATKIRTKYLQALEDDNYKKLPDLPYIQGFLKNYSEFLGLRSTTMFAIFRRQYNEKVRANKKMIEEPLTSSVWQITPNKVITSLVFILIVGLFTYFYSQFRALQIPPPLILESPVTDEIIQTEEIPVFGKTDVDATVTINNEPVLVKEDGKFYKDITLSLGMNTLIIEARSRVGKKTAIVRTITRTP